MSKQLWTLANMPDLKGKIMIVTGANSGLGLEATKALAAKGAHVVMACRNLARAEQAKTKIISTYPQAELKPMALDLMDLASIKTFATQFQSTYKRLDVLLNNAGIMMVPYGLTKNGFESQLGTNHLGHFVLTGLLLPVLFDTPQARVVNVASMAHRFGKMDFNNLQFAGGKGYSSMRAYGRSKLANLLFTYELQRYFETQGKNCLAVAAHPGVANTHLARSLEHKWWYKVFRPLADQIMQDAATGALPEIRAAVDPEVKGGQYYGPKGFREMAGLPVLVSSNAASHSLEDAQRLWQISEELTGVAYPR